MDSKLQSLRFLMNTICGKTGDSVGYLDASVEMFYDELIKRDWHHKDDEVEGWVMECHEGQEMDCSECANYHTGLANKFKCQTRPATLQEVLDGKAVRS